MRRLAVPLAFIPLILVVITFPVLAAWQSTGVTAEALGQANLRATTDVTAELVGQIVAGTRYPVLARNEFYPWYLLGDPTTGEPIGWVFAELVSVQGDPNTLVISTLVVGADSPAAATTPASTAMAPAGLEASPTPNAPPSPTLSGAVVGTVLGEINVRYGPGVEYPRVGVARAGEQFEVVSRHTQLPWLQVRYTDAPEGLAWIASDLMEIQGDVNLLPAITRTQFNLPTLTPTASMLQAGSAFGAADVPLSPAFQALGDQIWQMMLNRDFDPNTSRLGAFFLMDLQTGETVTAGNDVAFSGMSLNKISILTSLFADLDVPPDNTQAVTIAEAMICSENISSNEMLGYVGDGNPFTGAADVTSFLQTLGLERTFITAPFDNDPFITPQPVSGVITTADQQSAEPDPFNQVTVDELGGLLGSVYECGYGDGGPLVEQFPDRFSAQECRKILHIMSSNRINALIEMGVPAGTVVAHKHGWIPDTHGDAAVVFTPGGNYVLVVALHNPTWIDYSDSFPLIAEISRMVYNYYNPDAPMTEIREGEVTEECELLGNPVVQDLQSNTFGLE